MITACKNWRAEQSPRSTARFVRQTPGKKQTARPNRLHSFYRARYYDTTTAEFTSRDPLEYVDGMSLMRGYFGISGIDPLGLDWLDNLANFTAGGADSLTMGTHAYLRRLLSINDGIDVENGWYQAGETTEMVVEVTVTLGAATSRHVAKRVVRSRLEAGARSRYRRAYKIEGGIIHHATPIKGHIGGIPSYFPLPYKFAARGKWNFQYVANVGEHARRKRPINC